MDKFLLKFFFRDYIFQFDVSTNLPLGESQNRATYFLKEKNFAKLVRQQFVNPDHMLFFKIVIATTEIFGKKKLWTWSCFDNSSRDFYEKIDLLLLLLLLLLSL